MITKQTLLKALLLGAIMTQTGVYALQTEPTVEYNTTTIDNAHRQACALLDNILISLERESISTLPAFEDINKKLKEITTLTKNVVAPDDFHQYSILNNAFRALFTNRFSDYRDAIKQFDNLRSSHKRTAVQSLANRLQTFAMSYISLVETGRLKEQKTTDIPTTISAPATQIFNSNTQTSGTVAQEPARPPVAEVRKPITYVPTTIRTVQPKATLIKRPFPYNQTMNQPFSYRAISHGATICAVSACAACTMALLLMKNFYYHHWNKVALHLNKAALLATAAIKVGAGSLLLQARIISTHF